jgi:succinoglycan biosynthesis transport protein ExoP
MDENELIHRLEQARLTPGSLGPQSLRHDPRSYPVVDGEVSVDAFGQLRATWDILVKHQWLILATTVILMVLVAVYSFKMKPIYQATGRLDIEAEMPLLQSLNDLFHTGEVDDSFLATQVSILESDNLIWETVQQLGLVTPEKSGADSTAAKNALIGGYRGRLKVERTKDTRMVLVSFESTDPREAALFVNTLINNYIESNFQTKYNATRQATGWMEGQLDELKLKVEKSQEAMVAYERQNNIVNLGEKQTVTESRFEDLSKELNEAQSDRLTKESLYKMVASNDAQVGFLQQGSNGLLASLEAKEVDLKEQYSEALSQYGPTYPKVLRLQDQMKDVDALIVRERRRMVENIHNEFLAAAKRQQFLAAALADQKKEVDKVSQLLIQFNLLKREFDSNQTLYDSLLQRLKDANVSAGLRATNIHTIDEAAVPSYPVRPNKPRNIEFALVAGLALGIALAFTQEALDNSIKNAQEMEKLTGLPTLAIIPMGTSSFRSRPSLMPGTGISINGGSSPVVEMAVLQKPGAAISEAYRALRTSVLLSTAERPPQVLLVTSSQPFEGKTSTSLNLAATLAQKGSRVLLVDADMRRPGLARALNLNTGNGLSGILTGAYEYDERLLQKVTGLDSLFVLSSGPRAPNPAELLCSIKMEQLVLALRQKFDHVIIDSPPILPITDATIISTLVDGVIMVVESDSTSRAALARACRVMEHSGGRILGTVFNKVDVRRDGYYGYRYYHGYYTSGSKSYYHDSHDDSRPAA